MYKVYTRDGCSFCELSKIILLERGIDFEEVNRWEDSQGMQFMKDNNYKTVPQIFDSKGIHIGGYTDLREKFK